MATDYTTISIKYHNEHRVIYQMFAEFYRLSGFFIDELCVEKINTSGEDLEIDSDDSTYLMRLDDESLCDVDTDNALDMIEEKHKDIFSDSYTKDVYNYLKKVFWIRACSGRVLHYSIFALRLMR